MDTLKRYSLVLGEADFVSEGLVAQLAGEGPLAVVGPAGVDLKTVRGGEDLVALEAGVDVAAAQREGARVADGLAGRRGGHRRGDGQRRVKQE